MKNLENYGVQLLSTKEIRRCNGGSLWSWSVVGFVVDMILDAYDNPQDFKTGFDAVYIKR